MPCVGMCDWHVDRYRREAFFQEAKRRDLFETGRDIIS
jgi:hypothetical protein